MQKELYTKNDYGRIRINLKEIMDARGISRNALARKIDARFEVIDKWYGGSVEKIDADVLARICYILECSPGEIIKYIE